MTVWLVVNDLGYEGIRADSITVCADRETAELFVAQRALSYQSADIHERHVWSVVNVPHVQADGAA